MRTLSAMTVEPHDKFVNQYRSGILQDEQDAAARTIVNLLGESSTMNEV